jgi:hypothetical protein
MRTLLALAATLAVASCLASEPASTSERPSRHLALIEQELGTRFDGNIVTLSGTFSSQEEIGDVLVAEGVDDRICVLDPDGVLRGFSRQVQTEFAFSPGRRTALRGYLSERGAFGHLNWCSYVFVTTTGPLTKSVVSNVRAGGFQRSRKCSFPSSPPPAADAARCGA